MRSDIGRKSSQKFMSLEAFDCDGKGKEGLA